jgi:hypothetical protein
MQTFFFSFPQWDYWVGGWVSGWGQHVRIIVKQTQASWSSHQYPNTHPLWLHSEEVACRWGEEVVGNFFSLFSIEALDSFSLGFCFISFFWIDRVRPLLLLEDEVAALSRLHREGRRRLQSGLRICECFGRSLLLTIRRGERSLLGGEMASEIPTQLIGIETQVQSLLKNLSYVIPSRSLSLSLCGFRANLRKRDGFTCLLCSLL